MNESTYMSYNYDTSNIHDNHIHSIHSKEVDYNIINEEHISHTRKNVSKPNKILRYTFSTR